MKTPSSMRHKLPVVLVAGLGGLFTVVDVACAQPWAATTAPDRTWKALAVSADGTKMVAAGANKRQLGPFGIDGPPASICVSADAGATWTQTSAPGNSWSSVASSADGTKLVAAADFDGVWDGTNYGDGLIYTSTNSGATWTPTTAPSEHWSAVASSADGSNIVAVGANAICILRAPAPAPPLPPAPQLAVGLPGASLGLSWFGAVNPLCAARKLRFELHQLGGGAHAANA